MNFEIIKNENQKLLFFIFFFDNILKGWNIKFRHVLGIDLGKIRIWDFMELLRETIKITNNVDWLIIGLSGESLH